METTDPLPIIFNNLNISIFNLEKQDYIFLTISVILIILSALISRAENIFFNLSSKELNQLLHNKENKYKLFLKFINSPKELLATFLTSKLVCYIGFIISSSYFLNSFFIFKKSSPLDFLIKIFIILFFIFIISDMLPRIISRKKIFNYNHKFASLIYILNKILYPVIKILTSSSFISNRTSKIKSFITIDDISNALNINDNKISKDNSLLKGIISFGNINAKEIKKSRVDVIAVEINTGLKRLMDIILDSRHSRIPVFSETFDNIKGILYIKDLLPYFSENDDFEWQKLIRPPYFVPETKKIKTLLKEFQANKIHIAIVIDEYGGTDGIITLEDILEEIVGEITDETDSEELFYSKINENTYLFEGKTLLNDFIKVLNLDEVFFDETKEDADTIAGIILNITGEIPEKERTINYKNLTFTVTSVDKRRIKEIRVIINTE